MKDLPKKEEEWKEILTPDQYRVLRGRETEAPFSGKLLHVDRDGVYKCYACGNPLFYSSAKFDSGTGWPSFDEAILGSVKNIEDYSHGMKRTETVCARCDSHLGHVFNDLPASQSTRQAGGPTKTGKRYCINSVCLDLEEKK